MIVRREHASCISSGKTLIMLISPFGQLQIKTDQKKNYQMLKSLSHLFLNTGIFVLPLIECCSIKPAQMKTNPKIVTLSVPTFLLPVAGSSS